MGSQEEKWILVVDDSPDMCDLLVFMLRQLGWKRTSRAMNGKSALAQLRATPERFRLVLVDWEMPDMNGVELLQALRADEALKQIPVLMVTANSQEYQVKQAIDLGIAGYLLKPLSTEVLERKIAQALAGLDFHTAGSAKAVAPCPEKEAESGSQ